MFFTRHGRPWSNPTTYAFPCTFRANFLLTRILFCLNRVTMRHLQKIILLSLIQMVGSSLRKIQVKTFICFLYRDFWNRRRFVHYVHTNKEFFGHITNCIYFTPIFSSFSCIKLQELTLLTIFLLIKLYICMKFTRSSEPLLLTWINFNPSIDKQSHAQLSVGLNYLSILKLQQWYGWSLGIHA